MEMENSLNPDFAESSTELCVCVCVTVYTDLSMSTVKQTQAIPFTGPYSLLVCHLRNLTGEN